MKLIDSICDCDCGDESQKISKRNEGYRRVNRRSSRTDKITLDIRFFENIFVVRD